MVTRWKRINYWIFIASILILGLVFSAAAWLSTAAYSYSSVRAAKRFRLNKRMQSLPDLHAKKKEQDEEEKKSGGYFGFFGSDNKNESEKKKDPTIQKQEESATSFGGFFGFFSSDDENKTDKKKSTIPNEDESSSGIIRSIAKRFENRKAAKKAKEAEEREKRLADMLEKEIRENSFLPGGFNASKISSALQNVEEGLTKARDELLVVRPSKPILSEEEKTRQKPLSEREKKLLAQKLADQSFVKRRESKKKESEEKDRLAKEQADQRKKVQEGKKEKTADSGSAENSERSNPLSVAQKFFSNLIEKQKRDKEEWIVVAPKTRIAPGQIVPITAAGLDLLLVASKDGSALHCIANSCPHLGTPLETGTLDRRPIENSESALANLTEGDNLQETDIAKLLTQDGCEDCIVCPLHRTAFALKSGEVRGEWCPYPPILGKVMGTVKAQNTLPVFDVRTRGKNIEVRLNSPFIETND